MRRSSRHSGRGIFVSHRGGDRRSLYKELLKEEPVSFHLRQRGDRHILWRELRETLQLAEKCKTPYAETVIKEKDGREKAYFIRFGFSRTASRASAAAVVVSGGQGFWPNPSHALTTEPMRRHRKVLGGSARVSDPLAGGDTIRFIKQSYNLEDIRVIPISG